MKIINLTLEKKEPTIPLVHIEDVILAEGDGHIARSAPHYFVGLALVSDLIFRGLPLQ